jgi:hypothetical protein
VGERGRGGEKGGQRDEAEKKKEKEKKRKEKKTKEIHVRMAIRMHWQVHTPDRRQVNERPSHLQTLEL